jgi:dipeptidyl aminopeptidase/acylaminoacyl peptidase
VVGPVWGFAFEEGAALGGDGRHLLVERAGELRTVRLLDPATARETVLQTLADGAWASDGFGVAWSPDGESLAFSGASTEDPPGNDGTSIHVSPIDGGFTRQITVGPADVGPAWSPDAEMVVFARWGHARYLGFDCDQPPDQIDYGLHVVPRDGGEEIRLTDDGCDAAPDWSPDGSTIAFIRRETTIATVPAAGGEAGELFEYTPDPSCRDREERHRGTEPPPSTTSPGRRTGGGSPSSPTTAFTRCVRMERTFV